MTFVIAHITDSHLSQEHPYFNGNFALIAAHLKSEQPDLVINTGDVSLHGADGRADLESARRMHEALELDWLAIPGNHDIGDNQEIARKRPVNAERRSRWLDVFGLDFWVRDVPGWRLLGINALLLGSNLPEDSDQNNFIAEAASGLGDRRLALFVHKPLFFDALEDTEVGGSAINPAPRAQLLAALGSVRPRLVCAGHLHEYREQALGDLHQIWAPAVSFTVPDWFSPPRGGKHIVGYVRIALEPDGSFTSRLVQPEGIVAHDLADFPEAYFDLSTIKAKMNAQTVDAK